MNQFNMITRRSARQAAKRQICDTVKQIDQDQKVIETIKLNAKLKTEPKAARPRPKPKSQPKQSNKKSNQNKKSCKRHKQKQKKKTVSNIKNNLAKDIIQNKSKLVQSKLETEEERPAKREDINRDEGEPDKKRQKCRHINFISIKTDPIIDHLKESIKLTDINLDDEILNQIALEGLSGISFGRLLNILDALFPSLKSITNENSQIYIWSVLIKRYFTYPPDCNVRAFHFNWRKLQEKASNGSTLNENSVIRGVFHDKPIKLPSQTLQRIARSSSSLYPVQDGLIMGSCNNYLDRVDITDIVIRTFNEEGALNSMHSLHSCYDLDNIFFVAAQNVRTRALLPNWVDPNIDIKLREYCTLEFIGRSRSLGAIFPNDKTLGRYRLMLLGKDFISQYQQNNTSPIIHHLRRFAIEKPTSWLEESARINNCRALMIRTKFDELTEEPTISELCYDPSKMKFDRCALTTVYEVISRSIDGLTQVEIRRQLNMPKFHLRNHLKNLLSLKIICSYANKDPENPFRVYKPAHKSRRRRLAIENKEKPRGIMANWDEADFRAKRIIGHKRSNFSQAEDSLLILCRITSILIEPKCRLSWCVNKRLIRDFLHKELIESHDKTSDACLRRIKYLKRLPNNIMSINELTAELQDDPDIRVLTNSEKTVDNDHKLNKKFTQVFTTVRAKIPNLLGITSALQTNFGHEILAIEGPKCGPQEVKVESVKLDPILNHQDLLDRYELIDCQSVASIVRAPTYEQPKNQVDVKFNNVSLVTMAFTLSSSLERSASITGTERSNSPTDYNEELNLDEENRMKKVQIRRKTQSWLLDQFFSNYPDKLINSVFSKLNKRSLLTRKCPAEQASLYKPKTKMSLKLNQSVLFLLNRYHSSSLIQLAYPVDKLQGVELDGTNEMASIALLTSLCSLSSFNLDLELRIPPNVVAIDQGNENFKSLCAKANDRVREMLARTDQQDFRTLYKCGSLADCLIVQPCDVKFRSREHIGQPRDPIELIDVISETSGRLEQDKRTNWMVKSFKFLDEIQSQNEKDFETNSIPIEFEARLWRSVGGEINRLTLFKMIESLLSWITVFPGIELDLLSQEFSHLMPNEHLIELLDFMEQLELICSQEIKPPEKKPRLFGYRILDQKSSLDNYKVPKKTYESSAHSYVKYCQLLNYR